MKNFQMTLKNIQQAVTFTAALKEGLTVSDVLPLSQEPYRHGSDSEATPFYFKFYLEHTDM